MRPRRFPRLAARVALTLAACACPAPGRTAPAATATSGFTADLRLGAGYRHNVLLGAVQPEDSALGLIEGEAFWTHLPSDTVEFVAFSNATFTRFVDSRDNPHELQAFAHAALRWLPRPWFTATPSLEGYHLKQVFDFSINHVDRRTALVAVSGGLAALALRWQATPRTWLELKPAAQRERFRDRSDDSRQHLGRATLGRTFFGDRLEFSVTGQAQRRDYDSRPQYTVAGRRLAGTRLLFDQRETEARVKIAWDAAARWRTVTAVSRTTNRDNGSGFFDYRHRAVRHEIAWQGEAAQLRFAARAGRYDYEVQTQGIGINPPFRLKEEFSFQTRLARPWTRRTTAFAQVVWERSRSNDPLARYRTHTAQAGVEVTL
jgi:hypothetical protein